MLVKISKKKNSYSARKGSKRFPNKNIAKFLNKPLVSYPIVEAIKSKLFDNVIVSSDSELINSIAKKYGANTVLRSKKLYKFSHELSACREYFSQKLLKGIELPEYFCVIYPTAILLKAKDLNNPLKYLIQKI